MKNYDFAKLAYDAYCKQAGGRSLVSGDPLPDFWGQSQEIQDAWWAAAEAVRHRAVAQWYAEGQG